MTPLVAARDVTIRFGPVPVVTGVDVSVPAGAEMVVTGRSGSGKTSLLLTLAGLLKPAEGNVTWPGLRSTLTARRRQIGRSGAVPARVDRRRERDVPLRQRGASRQQAVATH
jgi:ABC-type multidrug transport system ATPase subunit